MMKSTMNYRATFKRSNGVAMMMDFHADSLQLARDHAEHVAKGEAKIVGVLRVNYVPVEDRVPDSAGGAFYVSA